MLEPYNVQLRHLLHVATLLQCASCETNAIHVAGIQKLKLIAISDRVSGFAMV